jgi:hypothetical protein
VPASITYLPPVVTITDPISGTLFAPGVSIPFNGVVEGGKPPYTFKWSSSVDGDLGATNALLAKLSGAVKAGEVIVHAIKLEVTDANGQIGTATILVKVMVPVYLPQINKK